MSDSETSNREEALAVLGERLRRSRTIAGLSLAEASTITALPQSAILSYEERGVEPLGVDVRKLAVAYDVSMDYLAGFTDDAAPSRPPRRASKAPRATNRARRWGRVGALLLVGSCLGAGAIWTWDGTRAMDLTQDQARWQLLDREQNDQQRRNAALSLYGALRRDVYRIRDVAADPMSPTRLRGFLEGLLVKISELPTRPIPKWWKNEREK